MTGIYEIINIITNKSYIGSAKNIENRWKRHLKDLKNNKHHNIYLQRSFNKWGESYFKLKILELCNENELLIKENNYLKLDNLYNISKEAKGGDNLTNNPNKEIIIEKIKKTINENIENMTIQERKEKYGHLGEKNGMWKKQHSIETKEIISKKNKGKFIGENNPFYGKKHTEKTKKIISEFAKTRIKDKNGFYGKTHTEKTKKILSEINKGKYNGNQNKEFFIDDKLYFSLSEAGKDLNVHATTIRYRLNSDNFKNYKYK